MKAMTCIDLTTLPADDTPGACAGCAPRRSQPLGDDLLVALGLADLPPTVGAVCVYPTMVGPAVRALEGSGIPVASVATGFPAGLTPLKQRHLDQFDQHVRRGRRLWRLSRERLRPRGRPGRLVRVPHRRRAESQAQRFPSAAPQRLARREAGSKHRRGPGSHRQALCRRQAGAPRFRLQLRGSRSRRTRGRTGWARQSQGHP